MTRLEWTEPAVADLENIQDYIARDSAEYADALIQRLILSVDQLNRFRKAAGVCTNRQIQRSGSFLSRAVA